MEPENPNVPEGATAPGPSRRRANLALILILVLAGIAAVVLLRPARRTGAPDPQAPAPEAGQVPRGIIAVLVKLSPEAALVADRYRCPCGDGQETLGKYDCADDDAGDEMKTTLNRIVAEQKSLAAIDDAMVEKYGPAVLASSLPSAGD